MGHAFGVMVSARWHFSIKYQDRQDKTANATDAPWNLLLGEHKGGLGMPGQSFHNFPTSVSEVGHPGWQLGERGELTLVSRPIANFGDFRTPGKLFTPAPVSQSLHQAFHDKSSVRDGSSPSGCEPG